MLDVADRHPAGIQRRRSSRPGRRARREPFGHQPRREGAVPVPGDRQRRRRRRSVATVFGVRAVAGVRARPARPDRPCRSPGARSARPADHARGPALISCWMNPSLPSSSSSPGIDLRQQLIERTGRLQGTMLPAAAALRASASGNSSGVSYHDDSNHPATTALLHKRSGTPGSTPGSWSTKPRGWIRPGRPGWRRISWTPTPGSGPGVSGGGARAVPVPRQDTHLA